MKNQKIRKKFHCVMWCRIIVVLLSVLALVSCSKKKKDLNLSPLKDGYEFVYEKTKYTKTTDGHEIMHVPLQYVYRIKKEGKDGFKLDFTTRATSLEGKVLERNSKTQSYRIFDNYGRLTGKSKGRINPKLKGALLKLWLPPSKRKDGAKVKFSVSTYPWTISGPVKWEKWDVWKATCDAKRSKKLIFYFDKNSGFLVGSQSQILVGTNRKDLPVAESQIQKVIKMIKSKK